MEFCLPSIILEIQWSNNEVRSGSMSENFVISIDNFSVDFAISIPPGNCCIWNSSGNASQIDGVLIPRPLLAHWLFLKGWREFNLDCRIKKVTLCTLPNECTYFFRSNSQSTCNPKTLPIVCRHFKPNVFEKK